MEYGDLREIQSSEPGGFVAIELVVGLKVEKSVYANGGKIHGVGEGIVPLTWGTPFCEVCL